MEKLIQISQIDNTKKNPDSITRLGNDYIHIRIGADGQSGKYLETPVRFDGLSIFLCHTGSLTVEVNLEKYTINAGSIFILEPSSLVRTCESTDLAGEMVFISSPFLHDVNFDMQALQQTMLLKEKRIPQIKLNETETDIIDRYFKLLRDNANINGETSLAKNIARALVSAILYQFISIVNSRRENAVTETSSMSSRRLSYVHDFGRLVHKYYKSERSVAFYASKLFISPKYLSLLVKEATGRSAAAWIDEYVIMEAKNMLRFSGRNIQQITYDLNFPNQSSFGKYFKHLTGMSPTQYQKS